jgi:hypothetical protein
MPKTLPLPHNSEVNTQTNIIPNNIDSHVNYSNTINLKAFLY